MKVKRFHQFVHLEKGPANTAVTDFLSGDVFQVHNEYIKLFEEGAYDKIPEFINSLEAEKLIFKVDIDTWIPKTDLQEIDYNNLPMQLEIEEGGDLDLIGKKLQSFEISKITFYGNSRPQVPLIADEIIVIPKDFNQCIKESTVTGEFKKINENTYGFNMKYNSCWGRKIAITEHSEVKPCVFSDIVVGNLKEHKILDLIDKLKFYWELSKSKITKCKDCELKYICFDCRVIAKQKGGELLSPNPLCQYDPFKKI